MFEKEKIDKGTPIPLYFQLKNIILKYINEGNLKPGDSIPTEMELAQIFDISRTTIRQAITELVMEGVSYPCKEQRNVCSKAADPAGIYQERQSLA